MTKRDYNILLTRSDTKPEITNLENDFSKKTENLSPIVLMFQHSMYKATISNDPYLQHNERVAAKQYFDT